MILKSTKPPLLFKVVAALDTPVQAISVSSLLCNVQFFKATLFRKAVHRTPFTTAPVILGTVPELKGHRRLRGTLLFKE